MPAKNDIFLAVLIGEFWISGLFILSVIFLEIDNLDNLTLFTFISYSVGSFSAGILSDLIGRKPLFLFFSLLLFGGSIVLFWNLTAGFIIANLSIGPLNNLTFVFINENDRANSEINTIGVLLGWAASEITLGIMFLVLEDKNIFFYILSALTLIYAIAALIYTQQTQQFQENKLQLRQRTVREIFIPSHLRPIIGGSILMFMMQMFYYRTQFTLDKFGVSLQINTIIVGATEMIANISFYRIIKQCKRRLALQILIVCLMVLLFLLMMVSVPLQQTIIQGFMRLVDTCIMLVLGVYLPELFPVSERGKGTNYIMCFGVFGSALSGKIFTKLPFGYLQIFLFAAILASILMPETKVSKQSQQTKALIDETDTNDMK